MKQSVQHRKQEKRPLREDAERILSELGNLDEFLKGLSFEQFARDTKTVRAVERCLEIVGDSGGYMMKYHSSDPMFLSLSMLIDFDIAKTTRNYISHEYFRDTANRVFNTAKELLTHRVAIAAIVRP